MLFIGTLGRHSCWRRERFSSCRAWISSSKLCSSFSRDTWEHKGVAQGGRSSGTEHLACSPTCCTLLAMGLVVTFRARLA